MEDSPYYNHFPMSYKRRLPCPHYQKFPIQGCFDGKKYEFAPEDDYCTQCQYDPPKPEFRGRSESKILIYNYLLRHPKTMISEPK